MTWIDPVGHDKSGCEPRHGRLFFNENECVKYAHKLSRSLKMAKMRRGVTWMTWPESESRPTKFESAGARAKITWIRTESTWTWNCGTVQLHCVQCARTFQQHTHFRFNESRCILSSVVSLGTGRPFGAKCKRTSTRWYQSQPWG